MLKVEKLNFIVIDDNKVDCFIAEKNIVRSEGTGECRVFYEASLALEYIRLLGREASPTIVLVDIQMPVMNGFEFVEAFQQLSLENRESFHIYVLSSSVNEHDIARARGYESVRGFLNKPLTGNVIDELMRNHS